MEITDWATGNTYISVHHILMPPLQVPGTPSPPDYDTLSTHSRVSASDPPPDYSVAVTE